MTEKRALGRGLSALIPESTTILADNNNNEKVFNISVGSIKTNKYQPRVQFNEERLNDLARSIKEKGVIQPVLVRKTTDGYELIAGERRLRAAKRLNLEKIPAIIKDVADIDMLEISLIENIQREELNPIEEANAFERFVTEFKFTQDKIAQVLGKDKTTVSNTIRLLLLPKKIQDYVAKNSITAGHARSLLSLPTEDEQHRVCNLIMNKGLSVRETEKIVSRRIVRAPRRSSAKADPAMIDIASQLQHALGTRVKISNGKKRGIIHIEYYSTEDLNRILDLIMPKRP